MNLRDLQKKNRELSILSSIAQDLNQGLSLDDALESTLKQVVELFNLQTGWIWLFESEESIAQLKATYNLPPAFLERPELLGGTCYCIEKYLRGTMDNAANISEITCSRLKDLNSGTNGLRYHASVPLSSPERRIGLMNVLSTNSQQLSEADLQLLYTIGDLLSIAIERTRLFEKSKQAGRIEERNRLAREIHDTLAQGLSAISLKLETMGLLFDQNGSPKKIKSILAQTLKLTKENLNDARRSVMDLRASPLVENDLKAALEQLLSQCGLPYSLHYDCNSPLAVRLEMGIYRIAQEAIQNVVKHAKANHLQLHFQVDSTTLQLIIIDDGLGFDPEQQSLKGFGLVGINERVNLLKGQLSIQSQAGRGTRIEVNIPFKLSS